MKKITIILFVFVVILVGITPVLTRGFSHEKKATVENTNQELIKIAVCPTFYNAVSSIDDIVSLVKTQSTAESLSLMSRSQVDYVLAGRILKPSEKMFPFVILGSGYSFLSSDEKTITEEGLRKLNVYTDIDVGEVSRVFGLNNVYYTDDVYNYLFEGIIITSWDNTDYLRASTVHFVDEKGNRIPESRLPILFCLNSCDEEIVNTLKAHLTNT